MRTTLIIVLGIALTGAVLFVATNRSPIMHGGLSPNDQASYAEESTTSAQGMPPVATSTAHIDLPVIVYHIVRPRYKNDSAAVRAFELTPETFDAEMDHLKTAGYHVVHFSDLEHYFQNSAPLPSNPVILSFDDGWSDQFTYAFPILEKSSTTTPL